jgi:rhamnosyltransferase
MQTAVPRSVSAIIVTLDPIPDVLASLLRALVPQVSGIVVVDNGANGTNVEQLVQAHAAGKHILVRNGRNVGLATAQNQGLKLVLDGGADYVLLLDHDSMPSGDMVARLVAAVESGDSLDAKIAAAGPVFTDRDSVATSRFVQFGRLGYRRVRCKGVQSGALFADILISSGMLIPSAVLRDVGMMDDSLFVDHVDTEWCLRARAKGYRILGVCGARMQHHLGDRPARSIAGRRFYLRSPARHYYFVRNSVLLYRRRYAPLAWKIGDVSRLPFLMGAALLFCAPRFQHLKAIARGAVDGMRGRSGPLPATLHVDSTGRWQIPAAFVTTTSRLAVVHLVRAGNGLAPFRRFLESYRAHAAGIPHDLVILYKGFHGLRGIREHEALLAGLPHRWERVSDRGFDVHAYFEMVRKLDYDYFCFLNSYSRILERDWLAKLYRWASSKGVGVAGATASYQSFSSSAAEREHFLREMGWFARLRWRLGHVFEDMQAHLVAQRGAALLLSRVGLWDPAWYFPLFPNYHIRTNAFLASREALARVKIGPVFLKLSALMLESGHDSVTNQLMRLGLRPIMVGRDGTGYEKEEWSTVNVFRQGNQENLLVADNQTDLYAMTDISGRGQLSGLAWGEQVRSDDR